MCTYLNVAGGKESLSTARLALIPALVHATPENDQIPFGERQVARVFPLIRVQRSGTWQRWKALLQKIRVPQSVNASFTSTFSIMPHNSSITSNGKKMCIKGRPHLML